MQTISLLLKELNYEVEVARKMLTLMPEDKFDWKPHPKSSSLKQLGIHIAELPSWISMALNKTEIDFATMDYTPSPVVTTREILGLLENSFQSGKSSLDIAKEEDLLPSWTMRTGDQIHRVMNKYEVIRVSLNQITHHRAQLGVYLRLLDIPIPGSYGPSADEMNL